MVQVLYHLEVFLLAHYGPPSTETPTTEITTVWCHKNSWIYLTSTYYWWLLRPTITIRFDQKWKNTIRTALKHWSVEWHSCNAPLVSCPLDCSIVFCGCSVTWASARLVTDRLWQLCRRRVDVGVSRSVRLCGRPGQCQQWRRDIVLRQQAGDQGRHNGAVRLHE